MGLFIILDTVWGPMKRLNHEKGSFDYSVIRTERRTMAIRIDPQRGVVVRVPKKAKDREIQQLLEKKISWISKHLSLARQRASEIPRHNFMAGDIFLYRGEEYSLVFEVTKKTHIEIAGHYIIVGLRQDITKDRIPEIIRRWYIAKAREFFNERVAVYSPNIGIEPSRIFVRGQSKRWGSCSSRGNLNLNWKLVMAPPVILDYVVVHELCHLWHPNHGPEFWRLVGDIMPDYARHREWLKRNGHTLGF